MKAVREFAIEHPRPGLQREMRADGGPTHGLTLAEALGDHLIDRALHEAGRDTLASPAPSAVVDDLWRIAFEIGHEFLGRGSEPPGLGLGVAHGVILETPCMIGTILRIVDSLPGMAIPEQPFSRSRSRSHSCVQPGSAGRAPLIICPSMVRCMVTWNQFSTCSLSGRIRATSRRTLSPSSDMRTSFWFAA